MWELADGKAIRVSVHATLEEAMERAREAGRRRLDRQPRAAASRLDSSAPETAPARSTTTGLTPPGP